MDPDHKKKYSVRLVLKYNEDGILECEIKELNVPSSDSFKNNKPAKCYLMQANILKLNEKGNDKGKSTDPNSKQSYKKSQKRKTKTLTHKSDNRIIFDNEKIEFRMFNLNDNGEKIDEINNDETWLHLSLKLVSKYGILNKEKMIKQGKISLRLIEERAGGMCYSAWFPLY